MKATTRRAQREPLYELVLDESFELANDVADCVEMIFEIANPDTSKIGLVHWMELTAGDILGVDNSEEFEEMIDMEVEQIRESDYSEEVKNEIEKCKNEEFSKIAGHSITKVKIIEDGVVKFETTTKRGTATRKDTQANIVANEWNEMFKAIGSLTAWPDVDPDTNEIMELGSSEDLDGTDSYVDVSGIKIQFF